MLYTVTDQYIAFLVLLSHVLPIELWETSCVSSSLHADRKKYIKRGNQGIIAEFYNFIQNMNIDGFM